MRVSLTRMVSSIAEYSKTVDIMDGRNRADHLCTAADGDEWLTNSKAVKLMDTTNGMVVVPVETLACK
jgi:hypothetical protein